MKSYMDVEDLEVYRKLCQLHIDICDSEPHVALRGEVRNRLANSPIFQQLPSTTRGEK